MKFSELPESVQVVAAELLNKQLDHYVSWEDENRTEKAEGIAETVREAFLKIYE